MRPGEFIASTMQKNHREGDWESYDGRLVNFFRDLLAVLKCDELAVTAFHRVFSRRRRTPGLERSWLSRCAA